MGQGLFGSTTLRRLAGALRDVANERQLVLGPLTRLGVIEVEKCDQTFLLGQWHVDESPRRDGVQLRRRVACSRVQVSVRHDGGLASFQIVDIGTEVPEPQNTGQTVDAGSVPVSRDDNRLGAPVHEAVAGAADLQSATDQFRGAEADVIGVILPAEDVAEFDQRRTHPIRAALARDVPRDAGHSQRSAAFVRERLSARRQPADLAVRQSDPVGHIVLGLQLDRLTDGRLDSASILGKDGAEAVLIGERLVRGTAEQLLATRRCRQFQARELEAPGPETTSAHRERHLALPLLLSLQAIGQLRHQGGIVGLQADQPLSFQGDVDLTGKEVCEPAIRVEDRRHQEPVPERLAAPSPVQNVDLNRLHRCHGIVDPAHRVRIGFRGLEKPAVPTEDLATVVAGQATEGVVDEHHRVVRLPRIGDDHRHARRAHGSHEGIGAVIHAANLVRDPDVGRVGSAVISVGHVAWTVKVDGQDELQVEVASERCDRPRRSGRSAIKLHGRSDPAS